MQRAIERVRNNMVQFATASLRVCRNGEHIMKSSKSMLLAVLLSLVAVAAMAGDCIQGQWSIANFQYHPDGSVTEGQALSDRHCLADDVIMDEFRSLDAAGTVNFRGVSFQVQNGEQVQIFWAMVGDPGYTAISGQYDGDRRLTTTGVGVDMLGEFAERFVMQFHDDGLSYDMSMDRNYAKWDVWIQPFNRLEANYSFADVQPLRTKPVSEIAEVAPEAVAASQFVILDGFALASIDRAADDVVISFSSRYGSPDRWRTLAWSAKTGNVTPAEIFLDESE